MIVHDNVDMNRYNGDELPKKSFSQEVIEGFSKLTMDQKRSTIDNLSLASKQTDWSSFESKDEHLNLLYGEFSENTIAQYVLPYGIAPNFVIDSQVFHIPMVTEESSVVAAAARGAKFWSSRGGIQTQLLGTSKKGHVHFFWSGSYSELKFYFQQFLGFLNQELNTLTQNMQSRGGGVESVDLVDQSQHLKNYFQIQLNCQTCNAMGANFINTLLEKTAYLWKRFLDAQGLGSRLNIIMSILTNYNDQCSVQAKVRCPVQQIGMQGSLSAEEFALKFKAAVDIANVSIDRAVTHNKGIMNGVDAVVIATGNDFRATEAGIHAYACSSGHYRSLTSCQLQQGDFEFSITLPLSIGTTGGLTSLHPLAKKSLEILRHPDAQQLMKIIAAAGLIQNFSAVRSLVTTGIQKGHMKMHLQNILNQLQASDSEKQLAKDFFNDKVVSFSGVRDFLQQTRKEH